jgi:SAM-dependent methyltransferase
MTSKTDQERGLTDDSRRHRLRVTFDAAPALYDRTRPVCPPAVFDDLVTLARLRPGARIVEIGCGTGQATLPLAERGFRIVGIELGERLAALARRKLAAFPNVEIVTSTFEAWDGVGAPFDAIVAVHAIHWIDPAVRYAKSAHVLRNDGALAIVASRDVLPDDADPFWREVQEDYRAIAPDDPPPPPPHPDAVSDFGAEIAASGFFRNVAARRYLWGVTSSADDYLALLRTSSWHKALGDEARRNLFERIRQRLEARPTGTVTRPLLTTLNVARRT